MSKQKFELAEWDVEKIIAMAMSDKLSLPKFQRGLSWNQKRKESLIATMREGNPIGTILLNEVTSNEQYQIIDGLQRISTILDYKKNFKKYFDETFMPIDLIKELVTINFHHNGFKVEKDSLAFSKQVSEILQLLIDSYKETYDTEKHETRHYSRVVIDNLPNGYKNTFNSSEDMKRKIEDKLDEIFKNVEENEKLENFDIPIIIYKGQESYLPDIFEKLNTGGVILSKYEIFSARWVNNDIGKVNKVLHTLLDNKYDAITEDEEGYDIEYDKQDDTDSDSMNLFEFCFSLGEYVQNHWKSRVTKNTQLFNKKKNVGFELLCLILTSRINSTEYLEYLFGSDLRGYFNSNRDLSQELFDAIDDILEQMKFLDKYVLSNNRVVLFSDYQKFHIFMSLFNNQYELVHSIEYSNGERVETSDFKNALDKTQHISDKYDKIIEQMETFIKKKRKQKNFTEKFKQNVIPVVLNHTLNRHWYTNRQVSDLENQIKTNNDVYFKPLDYKELESNLIGWLNMQELDERYQKSRVPQDVQLVNTLLHHMFTLVDMPYNSKSNFANKIDFDHIIPKNLLKEVYNEVPVSGALNIWPIYYKDNRSKKERNIDDIATKAIRSIDKDYYNLIGISDRAIHQASLLKDIENRDVFLESFKKYLVTRRTEYISLVLQVSKLYGEHRF